MSERHPVLIGAKPGEFVGVVVKCPRYDCDWREEHASAEVVNEYGVCDPIPRRCPEHGLLVAIESIELILRDPMPTHLPVRER